MTFVDESLFSLARIMWEGVSQTWRHNLNLTGAGVTSVADNATNDSVDITIGGADGEHVYWVGKNGNDAHDGLSPAKPKLTIGSAVTAATAMTPATGNRFVIVIDDAGAYSENVSLPQWVSLRAPSAKILGIAPASTPVVTMAANTTLDVGEVTGITDQKCISAAGPARVTAGSVTSTGTSDVGINVASGVVRASVHDLTSATTARNVEAGATLALLALTASGAATGAGTSLIVSPA